MRLQCYFCGKSVSNEVPEETVVRAVLVCPECIYPGWLVTLYRAAFPEAAHAQEMECRGEAWMTQKGNTGGPQ